MRSLVFFIFVAAFCLSGVGYAKAGEPFVLIDTVLPEDAEPAPAATASEQPLSDCYTVSEVRELSIPGLDRTHEVTIIERR